MPRTSTWTDEEDDALRLAYSHWPVRWDLLHERSAQRDRQAVLSRASALGITRGRLAVPDFSSVSDAQWAYFAGMVDADGTIAIKQGGCRVGVILTNTHRPLIDWALTVFPGGTSHTITAEKSNSYRDRPGRPAFAQAKRDMHRASWQRLGVVVPLLRGIAPHMIVKRERAEQALAVALEDAA